MTSDMMKTERSRRGLLAAAAAAVAGAAAASVARFTPVKGADGDPVTVGGTFEGENATHIITTSSYAIHGQSDSSRGLQGTSVSGQGVHGDSQESAGVAGVSVSGNGVRGTSTSSRGVWGSSTSGPGVSGDSSQGTGVTGSSDTAVGVRGTGSIGVEGAGSTGLKATAKGGTALHTTSGKVRFDGISGIALIPGGQTEVRVRPDVSVDGNTFVLLSPEANLGPRALWYIVNQQNNEVIIRMDRSRQNNARIGYLILQQSS
jgi:hypothetical protein